MRYISCNNENNGWLCIQYVQDIFPGGWIPPFSYGRGHQMNLGMQKSYCRLDCYMGMYSERLLVRFILDTLKSSLVGLDNSAWEFDWCWERVLDKRCLDNQKGTQQHAGADKGRLKGYILHSSAVKINCKSFCALG